jgi:hypothetical protein
MRRRSWGHNLTRSFGNFATIALFNTSAPVQYRNLSYEIPWNLVPSWGTQLDVRVGRGGRGWHEPQRLPFTGIAPVCAASKRVFGPLGTDSYSSHVIRGWPKYPRHDRGSPERSHIIAILPSLRTKINTFTISTLTSNHADSDLQK